MGERQDATLISDLKEINFQPLWDRFQTLTPINPKAKDKAFIWKWDDIEPLTVRAGNEVAMEDAGYDAKVIYTSLLEAFFTELKIAFYGALFIGFPFIAIQF